MKFKIGDIVKDPDSKWIAELVTFDGELKWKVITDDDGDRYLEPTFAPYFPCHEEHFELTTQFTKASIDISWNLVSHVQSFRETHDISMNDAYIALIEAGLLNYSVRDVDGNNKEKGDM